MDGVEQPYETLWLIFVTGLGLILGSFATALAYRLPRGESTAEGRSKCPGCGATIRAIDNVPVFSYLALRGRCRNCHTRISPRYPLTELATAILFLATALRFGVSWETAIYAIFFWALVVLTVIDLEHQLLPNKIVYPLLAFTYAAFALTEVLGSREMDLTGTALLGAAGAVGVALITMWPYKEPGDATGEEDGAKQDEAAQATDELGSPVRELGFGVLALVVWVALLMMALLDSPIHGFEGALVGGGLFSLLLVAVALIGSAVAGRTAMGGGDIKLALGLGAVLGYLEAPGVVMMGMFLSFLAGGVLSIGILAVTRNRGMQIPFGPFLALGTILAVFFGGDLLDAYLSTL